MINCKEVNIIPNEDSTYKLEFVGCKFTDNGKEIEGNITFPRVLEEDVKSVDKDAKNFYDFKPRYIPLVTDEQTELFSICIPE